MNVVWTDAALAQLQAVQDFIARESPTYNLVEILAVIHAARDLRQADFEPL